VNANGIALNVVVDGPANAPCVTLLGGITNDHSLWDAHAAELARRFRVLRVDARGHGESSSAKPPYSLDMLAHDVVAAWDHLGIERSCVGGLGLGGVVAAEIAWRHPQRVTGLVPVSCRAKRTPEYEAIWPPMIEAAKRGGMNAIVDPTIGRWFSDEFRAAHPEVMQRIRAAILKTTLDGYFGAIAALLMLDWQSRLSRFAMPVMYVSGELDRVGAPPSVMQEMCDATPGATHVVLPGATHISVVCNPGAFNAALGQFIERVA
jgi:3-oxoadipate enol-lactonase